MNPHLAGAAVFLLAAPAFSMPRPVRGARELQSELTAVQREIAAIQKEMTPRIGELGALTERYADAPDLKVFEADRARLHKFIYHRIITVNEKLTVFRDLRKELQWTQGAKILSGLAVAPKEDKSRDIVNILHFDDYTTPVVQFLSDADNALQTDNKFFAAERKARAENKRSERRQIYYTAGGGAALLSLGLMIWAARGRRRARPPGILPASAPPARLVQKTSEPEEPSAGSKLGGQYRVKSRLGDGPLGTVYDAFDVNTRRPVILKRLRGELHRDERDLDRLLAGARRAMELKHRNLAEIFAVFVEFERVHLVMEPVRGKKLAEFLSSFNRVSMASLKPVLIQTIKAVHHAHDAGLLHGELSPSVISLDEKGVVMVEDFGIGALARKSAAKFSWNELSGSPAYMAPEAELGTLFKESDFFSLGVILYELATGERPFEGPDFLEQKRARRYRPPSQVLEIAPGALDAVVAKCLQPEPLSRYRDALALLEAVEGLP